MREGSAGSGFQKAISVMRYASAMIRSAKPKAWKVSTLRAWMPSAWPMASLPPRRSTIRVGDARELGQLRGGERARGAGAHNEHVDLVGKLGGPINADAGGRLDSRVTGNVTVVVELHGLSSLRCGPAVAVQVFDNRILCSIIEIPCLIQDCTTDMTQVTSARNWGLTFSGRRVIVFVYDFVLDEE